jgi:phosphate-selective porin OprO/OprP
VNLTDGTLQGGKFGRVTPMVNWYLTDNLRLEFAYGYGRLNETNVIGRTMFFQSRLQFEL